MKNAFLFRAARRGSRSADFWYRQEQEKEKSMAYFRRTQQEDAYTPRFRPPRSGKAEDRDSYAEEEVPDYYAEEEDPEYYGEEPDDGFAEMYEAEYPEEELTEEEKQEETRLKYRNAAGAGDLFGIVAGIAVILALTFFLIGMYQFLSSELSDSFALLQTKL